MPLITGISSFKFSFTRPFRRVCPGNPEFVSFSIFIAVNARSVHRQQHTFFSHGSNPVIPRTLTLIFVEQLPHRQFRCILFQICAITQSRASSTAMHRFQHLFHLVNFIYNLFRSSSSGGITCSRICSAVLALGLRNPNLKLVWGGIIGHSNQNFHFTAMFALF